MKWLQRLLRTKAKEPEPNFLRRKFDEVDNRLAALEAARTAINDALVDYHAKHETPASGPLARKEGV